MNNYANPNLSHKEKIGGSLSHHKRRFINNGGGPSVAEKESMKAATSVINGLQANNKIFDDFEIPFETKKERGPSIIGLIDSMPP
jgi:hypothetical protein